MKLASISIPLALLSCCVCFFLLGQIAGFREGCLGVNDLKILLGITSGGPTFSGGPGLSEELGIKYIVLCGSFLLFLGCKLIGNGDTSKILGFIALVSAIFLEWRLLALKYSIGNGSTGLYRDLLVNSCVYDWFCLIAAIILLLIQLLEVLSPKLGINAPS